MKKLVLVFALLIGIGSFNYTAEAQNINISINIGRQPAWGPVGHDYAGYYYFPDIDCYYDVNLGLFHYMNRGRWISARHLPYAYSHYDLYGLYKVVLNVREPWRYHRTHYRDYARYKGHRNQIVIRDSRDVRYRDSRNNRVVWYSDKNRPSAPRKEYKHDNRNNNYNKNAQNNRYDNKDNKRSRNDSNKKYTDRSNSQKDVKKSENRSNNRSDKNQNRNYNSSNQSKRNSSNDKNVRQSTSSKSSNYRLVSNTNKNSGRGR